MNMDEYLEVCDGDRLNYLIASGIVFVDGIEYIGISMDGTEVGIGNVGNEKQVERYLSEYPTPCDW